jgi:hypothetical protein
VPISKLCPRKQSLLKISLKMNLFPTMACLAPSFFQYGKLNKKE